MNAKRAYRYHIVDVFTEVPLEGNGLAVFPHGSGLDETTMQRIAREMNQAETTFVSATTRSDCAARFRIFTPAREMPFAGHPTLGTSFVLLQEGVVAKGSHEFLLETKLGAVPVRVEESEHPMIWLATPPIRFGRNYPRAACAEAVGLSTADLLDAEPQIVSAPNPAVFVAVKDKETVDRAWLDLRSLGKLKGESKDSFFVFVFTPTVQGAYSRMFAPEYGVPEDPATGSATGPLAAYMMSCGLVSSTDGTRFVSEQGTKMGRRSFLHVLIHGKNGETGIEIGGYVTPVAEGTLTI